MKANRAGRRLAASDDGVSNVLGGILFFALIFIVLVIIQTSFVPRWEEDREAVHMAALGGQFAAVKSEADRQAADSSLQPVGLPLTLEQRTASRFFSSDQLPATVTFEPGVQNVQLQATELLRFTEGGQNLAGASETWIDVPGTDTLSDIAEVQHLRLRLNDVANEDDGDSITVEIEDQNGFAGRLTAYLDGDPPDAFVNTRIERADGFVIYDQGYSFHQVSGINFWWIDALADELHFADLLGAAEAPFSLTLSENGIQGQFTATYVDANTGGSSGSSGVLELDWERELDSGVLSLEAQNGYYPSQTFRLQNGAIVLQQRDGTVLTTSPLFTATADAVTTSISLTLPALTGEAIAGTGSGTSTLILDGGAGSSLTGTAPDFRVVMGTDDADLWEDYLRKVLEDAGLDDAVGEFDLTSTADEVDLTIYGRTASPTSTEHDLSLEIHYASIEVRLDA